MTNIVSLNETLISDGYQPGAKATDFKLKSVDGKNYSMSDYKDAKGFIVFTCNTCPFAVKYQDRINDLAKKYKPKGYILIAINSMTLKYSQMILMQKCRIKLKTMDLFFRI